MPQALLYRVVRFARVSCPRLRFGLCPGSPRCLSTLFLPGTVPYGTVDGRRMLYDVKRISFCPTRYWPTVADGM